MDGLAALERDRDEGHIDGSCDSCIGSNLDGAFYAGLRRRLIDCIDTNNVSTYKSCSNARIPDQEIRVRST